MTAQETPISEEDETPFSTGHETPFLTAYETPFLTAHQTPFLTAHETPSVTAEVPPTPNISELTNENETQRRENVYDGMYYINSRLAEIKKYYKNTEATIICDEDRLNYNIVAINSTIEVKSDSLCQASVYGRHNKIIANGPISFLIYADTNYLTEEFDLSDPKRHPLWRVIGSNNVFKTNFTGKATEDYSIAWYGFDGKGTVFPELGSNMKFENIIYGDIINMVSYEQISASRELEMKNFIMLSVKSGAKPPQKPLSLLVIVNIVGAISLILTIVIIFIVFKYGCKDYESE